MESFKFGENDNEELDLSIGGDSGTSAPKQTRPVPPAAKSIPSRPVAQRPVAPQPSQLKQQSKPKVTPSPKTAPVRQPMPPKRQMPAPLPPAPVIVPTPEPEHAQESYQNNYQQAELSQSFRPAEEERYSPIIAQQPIRRESPTELFGPQSREPENNNYRRETKDEASSKKKGGFFAKKPKKPSKNNYAGNRTKVLVIRFVGGAIIAIVGIAGLKTILLPNTGPTPEQVIATVQNSINYTKFPSVEGGVIAANFTKAYLNYEDTQEGRNSRATALQQYVPAAILKNIDVTFGVTNTEGQIVRLNQTVSDGPYVVKVQNVDNTHAVYTLSAVVQTSNGTNTFYLDVPVVYNSESDSFAIYGYPTFVNPPANPTASGATEADLVLNWVNDKEVADAFRTDLETYLAAWAISDEAVIPRYLTPSVDGKPTATLAARTGLKKSVTFKSLDSLTVEGYTNEQLSSGSVDPNLRRAQAIVSWTDAANYTVYRQSYLLDIVYSETNSQWFIQNIESSYLTQQIEN